MIHEKMCFRSDGSEASVVNSPVTTWLSLNNVLYQIQSELGNLVNTN